MELNMYAIQDTKGEIFEMPVCFPNNKTAIRQFGDWLKDTRLKFCQHIADYRLYRIGSFDNVSGAIKNLQTIEYVSQGLDFMDKEEVKK